MSNELKPDSPGAQTSIPHMQERTRSWLAKCVAMICILSIIAMLPAFIFGDLDVEQSKNILTILPILTGLLGTVLGFYFGQNSQNK